MPIFFGIVKNGHKSIPDSDEYSDIVSNHRFVPGIIYFVAEQSHMDDRDDDLIPCFKVANGLFAECLVKSFPDSDKFFFKKIYFHKFTSFPFYSLSKPSKIKLLQLRNRDIGLTIENPSPDGDGHTDWLQCHCKSFLPKELWFGCDVPLRLALSL
jgi:hypothetical protein